MQLLSIATQSVASLLQDFLDIIGHGEFLPNEELLDWLGKYACSFDTVTADVCENVLFLLCGPDTNNTNIVSTN